MALTIKVFDTDGNEATVNITGAAQTYLDLNSATADQIRMVTIADYTIIVNTTVALAAATSADYNITRVHPDFDIMTSWNPTTDTYHSTEEDTSGHPLGFWKYTQADNDFATWTGPELSSVWANTIGQWDDSSRNPAGFKVTFRDRANNSTTYEVIDNFYETPETTVEGIALRLQRKLQAAGARNALIHWEATSANKGRMVITSPHRGTDTVAASITGITAPDNAYDLSDASSTTRPFDYSRGTTTDGSGAVFTEAEILDRWTRVAPPDQPNADLDATTMPVKMVRTTVSPLVFDVSAITWGFRPNGNDDTNPVPSLWEDGTKIKDIVFHRNRMVLAGDESIVFSRAGDFFEFYLEDHDNITDSDPIDIELSSDQVTLVDYLIPFRQSVVIFTQAGRQFELNTPDNLTPTSAAITPSTSYETVTDVRPQPSGAMIYFAATRKDAAMLQEYFYDDSRVSNFAADVTAHVFNLLPTTLRTIQTSPNNNMVLVLPQNDNDVFVYTSFWDGNEKAQSAWTKYEFDDAYDIEDIAVIDNDCYMLVDAGDEGFVIEKFALARQVAEDTWDYVVHLDRQFEKTGSYSAGTGNTTWTLDLTDETIDTIVLGPDFTDSGAVKSPTVSGTTVTLVGDWTDGEVKIGRGYTMSVQLSEQYIRDFEGRAILSGRLQLRRITTNHRNSRAYSIRANMRARSADRTKSLDSSTIEDNGSLTANFGGNSKDLNLFIENATPKPSTITGIEILADHADRRR